MSETIDNIIKDQQKRLENIFDNHLKNGKKKFEGMKVQAPTENYSSPKQMFKLKEVTVR